MMKINAFEKMWTDEGAIILKFFLTLDKEEQLKRFKDGVKKMLINNGKLQMKTGEIEKNGIYTWNQVTIWLRKQIHPMHHGLWSR